MTHICVSKLTIISSDNGLSPGRHQANIWTHAGILLIQTLGTNFSKIVIEIHIFSLKKMHLKMAFTKWRQFCLGLNVLIEITVMPPRINEHKIQHVKTYHYRVCITMLWAHCSMYYRQASWRPPPWPALWYMYEEDGVGSAGSILNCDVLLTITIKSLIQGAQNCTLKCFSSRLAVVFMLYIEARW